MRRMLLIILILLSSIGSIFAERYEPIIGHSGSVMEAGLIRFLLGWAYSENDSSRFTSDSKFNFGIDFGAGARTELLNRIDYNSQNSSDFQWSNWAEMLKIRISEEAKGPAYSLGLGVRIPVRHAESMGLITGLYISSGIKDIDFDFNLGFNPYLTYADIGNGVKERFRHFVNVDLLLGYKFLPFLKGVGGFEMKQFLAGSHKENNVKTEIPGGSDWTFVFGARIKPLDYPVLFDGNFAFGTSSNAEFDWQFKLGVQILPQSQEAEW